MTGVIADFPKFQFLALDGLPLANGIVDIYIAGTTTRTSTWQDEALTIANTNPIILDSRGEAMIWLDSTKSYKAVLKNAAGVIQWSQDNIVGSGVNQSIALSTAVLSTYQGAIAVNPTTRTNGYALQNGDLYFNTNTNRMMAYANGVWYATETMGATDAALVSYTPFGTGAVATNVQTKLRESVSVKDFGAVGDGVADDTAAIQAALNTGLSVFLPTGMNCLITAGLTFSADYQQLYGSGKITASGSLIALTATSKTGIQISGITLVCGNVYTAGGILFTSCTQSRVTGCQISKHGSYGVRLVTSSYCSVNENFFTAAALDSRWVTFSSATDIDVQGTNDHHSIKGNLCASSGGYGVGVVTNSASQTSNYHNIIGNVIDGYNSYGIYLYRNGDAATGQTVYGNIVNGNTVRNISGARSANPATPAVLDFGAGIYVQGAEKTSVVCNSISNTNTSTNTSLLAPGAIGVANAGDVLISGNKINDVLNGIFCTDANGYASTTGSLVITGNSIVNATTYGIELTTQSRVQITGNTIHTASYGIFTSGSAATDYVVTNNVLRAITNTAISLVSITRQLLSGNQIYNVTTSHGIALDGCTDLTIETNTVNTIGSRGIYVASNCVSPITVTNNSVTSAITGIFVNAFGTVTNNTMTSNTTDYAGVSYPCVLLDGTATPNVKGLSVSTSTPGGALTITNLLNGATGQQLIIQAGNANTTIQHNANIFLSGAVNFVMSSNSTLTLLKTVGIWVEVARKA